ncbi:MAG: HEAT repeat domain-containing protein, partial [Firmicutes bacterium]|nr:HEAT repeat domain-containing protein [Bacillota bacterium]
ATLGDANALVAMPELCKAVTDENWAVRAAVAKAMGQIGEPAAQMFLQRLAEDEVWIVSINAREALRKIESSYKTESILPALQYDDKQSVFMS